MKSLKNIFHLGIKELRGLQHDTVLLLLVVYAFSFGVYGPASGTGTELPTPQLLSSMKTNRSSQSVSPTRFFRRTPA